MDFYLRVRCGFCGGFKTGVRWSERARQLTSATQQRRCRTRSQNGWRKAFRYGLSGGCAEQNRTLNPKP